MFCGQAIILILFTLIPLINQKHWMVRIFDFVRVQVFIMQLACIILWLIFNLPSSIIDFIIISALCLSTIYQFLFIVKFTILNTKKSSDCKGGKKQSISILSANV